MVRRREAPSRTMKKTRAFILRDAAQAPLLGMRVERTDEFESCRDVRV
jgi:hypothetical protein